MWGLTEGFALRFMTQLPCLEHRGWEEKKRSAEDRGSRFPLSSTVKTQLCPRDCRAEQAVEPRQTACGDGRPQWNPIRKHFDEGHVSIPADHGEWYPAEEWSSFVSSSRTEKYLIHTENMTQRTLIKFLVLVSRYQYNCFSSFLKSHTPLNRPRSVFVKLECFQVTQDLTKVLAESPGLGEALRGDHTLSLEGQENLPGSHRASLEKTASGCIHCARAKTSHT